MRALRLGLALALLGAACSGGPAAGPSRPSAPDAAAARAAEAWFARSQGFDALEAYALADDSLGFAVARKWEGGALKLLLYVVQPVHLDEVAYLLLRRPGAPAEVFTYTTPQLYETGRVGGVRTRTVIRVPHLGARWGFGAAADLATELVAPVLPGDFAYVDAGVEVVEGEPCLRIEALPRVARNAATRFELAISQRSGVALRTRWFARERELGVVSISPGDVQGEGGLPERWHLAPVAGPGLDLVLRNRLTHVDLPDAVFTRVGLSSQRFPKF